MAEDDPEQLRAQVAALIADRKALDDVITFLIRTTSASVETIRETIPVIADVRPDVAADASRIVQTWTDFMAGVRIARAADVMQNAPTTGARQ